MKHKILSFLGVMLLVLSLTVMPGWHGQAAPASASNGSVTTSITITAAQQKAALAFWTHDAIANAKAFPLPALTGSPVGGLASPEETGTFGSAAAGAANPNADSIAQKAFPSDWQVGSEPAVDSAIVEAGTSAIYTSYAVNNWSAAQKIYPHVWVGRLSVTVPGGTGYCSATALYGNTFVTAAHCVYDTTANTWYSHWVFTPAYRAGSAPYGSFAATYCTVLTAWINQPGYSFSAIPYDVAVCTVGLNSTGHTLNYMVGNAGRTWGAGYTQSFFTMGYPWQSTSNVTLSSAGAYLRTCASESATYATANGSIERIGCGYGPGMSGSPLLKGYQQYAVAGYVNSVVSGYVVGTANLYGIHFTSSNIQVICGVRGC